jgi:hypothetical protein
MIPLCIKDEFEESRRERLRHTVTYVSSPSLRLARGAKQDVHDPIFEELTTQTTLEALECEAQ